MDLIIGFLSLLHLFISPYTKVEESFNIQACHDIIYYGPNIEKYDHNIFPGTVPRTFIGPLIISSISYPFVEIIKFFELPKYFSQYVVRLALGFLVICAWSRLRLEVAKIFGKPTSIWFTAITASQFHFLYYTTRTLPNTFALIFALLAFVSWLKQDHEWFMYHSGIAVLIFRCELCLLLGPMLVYDLIKRKLSLIKFLKHAVVGGSCCLLATVMVDSFFWGRYVWPEGEVFWFNVYKNQSHLWGSYPFLWYFYRCLPRALGISLLFVPLGLIIDRRVQILTTPALLFILTYSFLPHKELRFIIYTFPILNIAAARTCHFLTTTREKSTIRQLLAMAAILHLVGNLLFSGLLLFISSQNYPGGAAIQKLHEVVSPSEELNVHIDNLSAQTGVTQFMELNSHWRYNKTENLKSGSKELHSFTHLLVEAKAKYAYNLKHYNTTHEIIGNVDAYSHVSYNYLKFPPILIRFKPAIFILKNKINEDRAEYEIDTRENASSKKKSKQEHKNKENKS